LINTNAPVQANTPGNGSGSGTLVNTNAPVSSGSAG
jgi:hypothetical protein